MNLFFVITGFVILFVATSYKINYFLCAFSEIPKDFKKTFLKIKGWMFSALYLAILILLHYLCKLSFEYVLYIDLIVSLAMISIIDIKFRIVPNSVNLFIIISQVTIRFLLAGSSVDLLNLIFTVVIFLFLGIISRCTNEQFGMGDIKLLTIVTFVYGLSFMLYTLIIAMLSVLIVSVPLMILKKANLKTSVPFIPYYTFGVLLYLTLYYIIF